ncbi:hypothetical protein L1987_70064 [Smallanthus sonchifolius]|uniref:Uncharacterized protein n=1 Tax=Smallanthus sonchifolius TaxID=185202 RepID=A0ACB9AP51_9ASTR|nr:hypothetical protein L1987_70064 [Smallanthus sonchifolius]
MSAHHQTIIEHIVLLNVKPDIDSTKVATMMDEINGLASLGLTIHLSAGKLLSSTSTSLNFSHIAHCRFTSTDDLHAYNHHPEHLRVAGDVQLLIDEFVVVDWISNDISESLKLGCVMRVTLLKFNYDLVENDKDKFVEVMEGVKHQFKTTQRLSLGENFSHEMAKGHSIAMIAVFPDLESFDSDSELANLHKSNVKDFLESAVVVDYVVPSAKKH